MVVQKCTGFNSYLCCSSLDNWGYNIQVNNTLVQNAPKDGQYVRVQGLVKKHET